MNGNRKERLDKHVSVTLAVILLVIAFLLLGIGILCLTGPDASLKRESLENSRKQVNISQAQIDSYQAMAGTLTDDFAEARRQYNLAQATKNKAAWQVECDYYQRSITLYTFGSVALFLGSLFLIVTALRMITKGRRERTVMEPTETDNVQQEPQSPAPNA